MGYVPPPSNALIEARVEQADRRFGRDHRGEDEDRTRSRFAVTARLAGARHRGLRSRGRGTLLITPGAILFVASAVTTRITGVTEVLHCDRAVTITKSRLAAPWANTFVIVHGDGIYVRLGVAGTARRELRRALSESEVDLHEASSWRAPALPADPRLAHS